MNSDSVALPDSASLTRAPAAAASFFRGPLLEALRAMRKGCLRMELPDGQSVQFGDGAGAPPGILPVRAPARPIANVAVIRVRDESFF